MRHVLTRQQLYDMIWERAVSKVGPELGLSDVGLRKQCEKHGIPLPNPRYWGRLHAGKPVERTPLGPAPNGIGETITITPRPGTISQPEILTAIKGIGDRVMGVDVPQKLHPLVARTLSEARKHRANDRGAITNLGPEVFQIRAHPDTLDRLGALLNGLVYRALAIGYQFKSGREGIEMLVNEELIGFSVSQTIRRSLHVKTKEEQDRVARWDAKNGFNMNNWSNRPTIPYYDFTPTGEMALELSGWYSGYALQKRFADTRVRKIEGRIPEILASFTTAAACKKLQRAAESERARLEEIARNHRAEQARLAKLENDRVAYLSRKLALAEERNQLTAFLSQLPAGLEGDGSLKYDAFISWANARLKTMNDELNLKAIEAEIASIKAFDEDPPRA